MRNGEFSQKIIENIYTLSPVSNYPKVLLHIWLILNLERVYCVVWFCFYSTVDALFPYLPYITVLTFITFNTTLSNFF